ncbi:hypothetical protein HYS49_00700 [Candidatus Woesearchaeota archaeon]|nr:hypothetical protein [Candidatus Woesearchaeota archaeon]
MGYIDEPSFQPEEVVAVEVTVPRNHRIHFRLNKEECERVKLNSQNRGFVKISDYLRSLALEHDIVMQEKLFQIDRNVKKVLELVEKI